MERLLKPEDVKDRLGLTSVHTIYRWAESGKLPVIRLSSRVLRFREADVAQFIEEHARAIPE
jgi:excisionase family DNA binding protein